MADRRRIVRLGRYGIPPANPDLVNLVPNPSFETNLTGWGLTNSAGVVPGTFVRTATWFDSGGWSCRISGNNAADTTARRIGVLTSTGINGMPVDPSTDYVMQAKVNVVSGVAGSTGGLRLRLRWYTAAGAAASVTDSTGPLVPAATPGVYNVNYTATAPADAAFASVEVCLVVDTVSDFVDFYVDNVMMTKGTIPVAYGDGDQPGWGWTGTPHASPSASLVSTIKDIDNNLDLFFVGGSFQFKSGERVTSMAAGSQRYVGERPARDRKSNGEISWTALVKGATADLALQAAEDALSILESTRTDLFFEERKEGATNSTFYEIRGPAKWTVSYEAMQFAGARSFECTVSIPVAPLPQGLPLPMTLAAAATVPATFQLPSPVPGDAPALVDVAITHSGGSAPPIWAMIAWSRRPGTPLAGSIVPFGDYEAETVATSLTGWASTASATASGGNHLAVTASGAGTASALIAVDPSTLDPDEFRETVDIEVWARLHVDKDLISPTFALSLEPFAGSGFGVPQYAVPHGSPGKRVPTPDPTAGSSKKRPVCLGVLTMPVEPTAPLKWNVKIAAAWAAGSSGTLALDKVAFVIAKQRALGKTGVPDDGAYPDFIASTAATTKTIRSDLSGRIASGPGNAGYSSGLGGQLLELPPGDVDMFIKLSSVVPDDPTVNPYTEQLSHTVDVKLNVTPRYLLARGT